VLVEAARFASTTGRGNHVAIVEEVRFASMIRQRVAAVTVEEVSCVSITGGRANVSIVAALRSANTKK